jgi:hypothetical protein
MKAVRSCSIGGARRTRSAYMLNSRSRESTGAPAIRGVIGGVFLKGGQGSRACQDYGSSRKRRRIERSEGRSNCLEYLKHYDVVVVHYGKPSAHDLGSPPVT